MAIRKLRYEGDPVLGKVCKEVKEDDTASERIGAGYA